jgi:hypothetical protein
MGRDASHDPEVGLEESWEAVWCIEVDGAPDTASSQPRRDSAKERPRVPLRSVLLSVITAISLRRESGRGRFGSRLEFGDPEPQQHARVLAHRARAPAPAQVSQRETERQLALFGESHEVASTVGARKTRITGNIEGSAGDPQGQVPNHWRQRRCHGTSAAALHPQASVDGLLAVSMICDARSVIGSKVLLFAPR